MLVIHVGYSQNFPPPVNLQVIIDGEEPLLIWEAPTKDLAYYNIYRNNLLVGNTTNLEYSDTIQFVYFNEWYVTAVYVNPNGESDPSNTAVLAVPLLEQIPYFENFDNEVAIWSTKVITGQTEWQLVDFTSFSGTQSAGCYSPIYGNKSILYSPPIIGNLDGEIELSFWYKCPVENSNSDELKVYRFDWQGDTILLSGVLTNQNQWTQKKIILGDLDEFHISFESTSKGGGGVYIDSIGITEIFTSVNEKLNVDKIQLYQNIPNPFNFKTTIGFYLPQNEKVKLSIYNHNGQLVKMILDEKIPRGEHFIDFYQMELSSGVYYYSIETNEKKLVKKFIIN
jgi:hypothetical protein